MDRQPCTKVNVPSYRFTDVESDGPRSFELVDQNQSPGSGGCYDLEPWGPMRLFFNIQDTLNRRTTLAGSFHSLRKPSSSQNTLPRTYVSSKPPSGPRSQSRWSPKPPNAFIQSRFGLSRWACSARRIWSTASDQVPPTPWVQIRAGLYGVMEPPQRRQRRSFRAAGRPPSLFCMGLFSYFVSGLEIAVSNSPPQKPAPLHPAR